MGQIQTLNIQRDGSDFGQNTQAVYQHKYTAQKTARNKAQKQGANSCTNMMNDQTCTTIGHTYTHFTHATCQHKHMKVRKQPQSH